MTEAMNIPTITQEDLINFHSDHFHLISQSDTLEDGLSEVAELGHYADGRARTLTDEEIAIFRHSEIQALLLQRARAKLATDSPINSPTDQRELSDGEISESQDHVRSQIGPLFRGNSTSHLADGTAQRDLESNADVLADDDEDEEAAYARFLEEERKEFAKSTHRRRQRNRHDRNLGDRKLSTRRKIREMDASDSTSQVLSYDDDDPAPTLLPVKERPETLQLHQEDSANGRMIWWPELGDAPSKNLYVDA